MKATDRVKLMHQIAKKLSAENWSVVNLTLEQFNLPVAKTSRRLPLDYILRQISKAGDEVLTELAHHLEITMPRSGNAEPSFWLDGYARLFISHLARKKETVSALREQLERMGISGFVAHADIKPSREWQQEIEVALGTCDALAALMEPGFHKSFWTDHEVGFVFGRGLPVIPVNMGENPYGFLAKFQSHKFNDVETLAETLFKVLVNDPRTTKKISSAVMSRFERSKSFAMAGENLRLLKKIRYWDTGLVERLKIAVRKNDQIRGSFDVPEGVTKLLKKVKLQMTQTG